MLLDRTIVLVLLLQKNWTLLLSKEYQDGEQRVRLLHMHLVFELIHLFKSTSFRILMLNQRALRRLMQHNQLVKVDLGRLTPRLRVLSP